MDRVINSKIDKQSIYEIYRACRLCGAGAGYKMPIIQNVLDLEGDEVELKKKIRECVHIDVHLDDKMPPLICELCVDKVNDFYEFLEMCRRTNKQTRQRLGLPPQRTKDSSDSSDCILGVTEPVYINDDEDDEPLSRGPAKNAKIKKENLKNKKLDTKIKLGSKPPPPRKRGRSPSPAPAPSPSPSPPPRTTRHSKGSSHDDNTALSNLRNKDAKKSPKATPTPQPKSILKKEAKEDNTASLRSKRSKEPPKPEVPQKKVKLAVRAPPKPPPKPVRPPKPPPPAFTCPVCKQPNKSAQGNANHLRTHVVTFTNPRLACNPCGEWFPSGELAAAHHKRHRARGKPYACRGCRARFKCYQAYEDHVESTGCVPWTEVPDVKCGECWRLYPTFNLRDQHKCQGEDGRPGGKCFKCNRSYGLLKNLKKHESTCTAKMRGLIVDPVVMGRIRPLQVRTARCDPLLADRQTKLQHYDVGHVPEDFGLDPNCVYPYQRPLKPDYMVNIKSEIDDFYCDEDYVHWDSDSSLDDVTEERTRQVQSLSTLTLKTIFSNKMLGRVPRKKRKIKTEKSVFDSLMNDFEDDMSKEIDNLIGKLNESDDDSQDNDKNSDSILTVSLGINDSAQSYVNDSAEKESETSDGAKDNDLSKNDENNTLPNNDEAENNEKRELESTEEAENKYNDSEVSNENANDSQITNENANSDSQSLNDSKTETNDLVNDSGTNMDSDNLTKTISCDDRLSEDVNTSKEDNGTNENDSSENKIDDIESKLGKQNDTLDSSISNNELQSRLDKENVSCSTEQSEKRIDEETTGEESNVNNNSSSSRDDNKEDNTNDINSQGNVEDHEQNPEIENKSTDQSESREAIAENRSNEDNIINNENNENKLEDQINVSNENIDNAVDSDAQNDASNVINEQVDSHSEDISKTDEREDGNADDDKNDDDNETVNDKIDDDNKTMNDKNENNDILNGEVEEKSDELGLGDMNNVSDTEIDDKKLMDALNEHIGETNEKTEENSANDEKPKSCDNANENNDAGNTIYDTKNINDDNRTENKNNDGENATDYAENANNSTENASHGAGNRNNDTENANNDTDDGKTKIMLEDLIPNDDMRSMDLDSISDDDFNFDS